MSNEILQYLISRYLLISIIIKYSTKRMDSTNLNTSHKQTNIILPINIDTSEF